MLDEKIVLHHQCVLVGTGLSIQKLRKSLLVLKLIVILNLLFSCYTALILLLGLLKQVLALRLIVLPLLILIFLLLLSLFLELLYAHLMLTVDGVVSLLGRFASNSRII